MATGFSVPRIAPPNNTITSLKRIFDNADIIFSTTHGEYMPGDGNSIVPANTIVFETSAVGNFCSTRPVVALWDLAHGKRSIFWNYLTNPTAAPAAGGGGGGGGGGADIYRDAISQLIMYGPGDELPVRNLTIGPRPASITEPTLYGPMYLKVSKIPLKPKPTPDTTNAVINRIDKHLEDNMNAIKNNILVAAINFAEPKKLKIYILISCAALQLPGVTAIEGLQRPEPWRAETIEDIQRLESWRAEEIEDLQRVARWKAAAIGFTSLLGGANAPGVEFMSNDDETSTNDNITLGTISSPEANADMSAVGGSNVISPAPASCENGYAVQLLVRDKKIEPLRKKDGRFCLTEKEVDKAIQLSIEGKIDPLFSIIKYSEGHMKWGKILGNPITGSMKGGRRTLHRRKRRLNKSKRNRGNARR